MQPAYPLLVCYYTPITHQEEVKPPQEGGYIYREGYLMPIYVRYVIFKDDEFHLLKTLEELQASFAPLDSPDEALSYALATSRLSAYYEMKAPWVSVTSPTSWKTHMWSRAGVGMTCTCTTIGNAAAGRTPLRPSWCT